MRKLALGCCLLLLSAVTVATAGTTTPPTHVVRLPADRDLNDLAHADIYQWKFNYTVPTGYEVTKATLTYYDIWDWTRETNDHLYTHLLDCVIEYPGNGWTKINSNTYQKYDGEGGGDYFLGKGVAIGDWSDPGGGHATGFNLVYGFNKSELDSLNAFLKNGNNAAFGIDPDCHYNNCKVDLCMDIAKQATPELSTWMLLGLSGMAGGFAALRRRCRRG
jgi:hypothetical protein